jgi:hypothetical protein
MGSKRPVSKTVTFHVDVLRAQLVSQQKRCETVWAEVCAQEQEYVERKQVGAPAVQALKKYERLRDQYCAEEQRRVLLRGLVAENGGEV